MTIVEIHQPVIKGCEEKCIFLCSSGEAALFHTVHPLQRDHAYSHVEVPNSTLYILLHQARFFFH